MTQCYWFICLVLTILWICSIEARPGLENAEALPQQQFVYRLVRQLSRIPIDASEALVVPRGSPEETRRILNEIDKINMAFGYTKKSEVTVPRQSLTQQDYFYPRPVAQGPSFLHSNNHASYSKVPMRGELSRAVQPRTFEETTYYYSVPYIRVPLVEKRPITEIEESNARTITRDLLRSSLVTKAIEVRESKNLENCIGKKSDVIKRKPVTNHEEKDQDPDDPIDEYSEELEQEALEQVDPGVVEGLVDVLPGPSVQEIEDTYDSLSESGETNESSETQEEEYDQEESLPVTTLNPPLINDKFLHQEFLQKVKNENGHTRSFNFSQNSFIKGISDKFSKRKTSASDGNDEGVENLSEKPLRDYDDDEDDAVIEGIKAPWSGFAVAGPSNQKEVLAGGGLIIQRLRVRNGSIAVAGPGGVATAGSGGTAIVGPDGLAITHPRSLTIAGQGARVYEVPETTDLRKQLLALDARGVPKDGKLVAVGPAIHYNSD